jgi:hypothetical protein
MIDKKKHGICGLREVGFWELLANQITQMRLGKIAAGVWN